MPGDAGVRIVISGDDRGVISTWRRVDTAVERVEDSLEQVGRQAREAGQQLEAAGEAGEESGGMMSDAMDGVIGRGGKLGEVLSGLGPVGKTAAVAVGAAMVGVGLVIAGAVKAAQAAMDRFDALAQSKAYLGLTGEDAKKFGKVAAELYMDQWGETLKDSGEDVRNAMLFIMPTPAVMDSAIAPSLRVVAQRVRVLADSMGEDSKKVAYAIHQMLATGMARSVDEAFDLMHKGIARGIDGMDNLLDSMNEYPALIQQMGFSTKQLFGLIAQGADAGAFDDKVIDAFKEFRLRVTGGGKAVDDAFKSMGLNAQNLTKAIAKGGPEAAAALDAVLGKLREMQGTQAADLVIQSLFGGPGEDLGAAIYNLDPSTAEAALGDIAGAADTAAEALGSKPFAAIEGMRRRFEMLSADIGDKLAPMFDRLMGVVDRTAEAMGPHLGEAIRTTSQWFRDHEEVVSKFGHLIADYIAPAVGGALVIAFQSAAGVMMTLVYVGSLVYDGFEKVRRGIVFMADVVLANLATMGRAAAIVAEGLGMHGLADQLRKAAGQVEAFRDSVNASLGGIQDRIVHVEVTTTSSLSMGSKNTLSRRAAGGPLPLRFVAGEQGPEIIDLGANRAMTAGQTARAMAGAVAGTAAGAARAIVASLRVVSDGSTLADLLIGELRGGRIVFIDSANGRVQVA